jgi:small subunit ribosomal protein S20
MPITKQAEKKLRRDRKQNRNNSKKLTVMRTAVKAVRKNPTAKNMSEAFKILDKTAKAKGIHKNKASRLKSRLSKLLKK